MTTTPQSSQRKDDAKRPATLDARAAALLEEAARSMFRYAGDFLPLVIDRAAGAYVYDSRGRAILDFTSGQMCATLGHNHPAVVAAVARSTEQAMHLFSWMLAPPVIELCRELVALLPAELSKVMLLSTGGESNEVALRMAKFATGRFEVVGFAGSFHGLTAGAGSSTYSMGHQGYGPALPGTMAIGAPNCYRCPIRHCTDRCDMTCLEVGFALIDSQSAGSLAAFIAEPIISAGGVIVPPQNFFPRLKELCRERGMLLILDEAQTALGRLGANFAYEQDGAVPDVLTLSKTLGGGLPLSAAITSAEIEQRCYDGGFVHISSHASDPLPAAVGLAVLHTLAEERLVERAAEMGKRLHAGLHQLQQRYPVIGDVRGRGMLWGIEIVHDRESREPNAELGAAVTRRCLELGLSMNIVNVPGFSSVWRIAPPLTITKEELDRGLEILDQALSECLAK